ncbi:zinc finger MYM-type protein 1-like [Aphis gossypii]|uniref:zinc finger MYM-type protein 1-like n=1 Tax=Aphis gossypii TaxID=80765 RepID=UPI002158E9B3|nr:zinc finger MYM-type protein 1-like [Aphis gossypii]
MNRNKVFSSSQKRKLKEEKNKKISKLPKITSMFQKQEEQVQNDEMNSMNVDQAQNAINSDELNLSHPYPTDRGHFDQLSIVIRYVTEELDSNGIPCSLNINESFMGFTNITDQSAKGIENAIMKSFEVNNIQINKCRGQGYDGASVMSGLYNGLQKRICKREPNAVYVHCNRSSIKRWDLLLNVNSLSSHNNRSNSSKLEKIPTLKRLCPTRWSSRHDALFAVYFQYTDIMKALSHIEKASELLSNSLSNLENLRNQFDEIKSEAITIAEKWGINTSFSKKRNRQTKKFFDELCADQRLTDPEKNFKINVFYTNIDIIISQLRRRFMVLYSDTELTHFAKILVEQYSNDLSLSFIHQILSFRRVLLKNIKEVSSVKELAELLIVQNICILSSVPEVAIVLKLFLTIPVTSATAERSFSKLKLIKSYLRSTMAQQRLSDLSVLRIENEKIRSLDINMLVDKFAEKNARRSQKFK